MARVGPRHGLVVIALIALVVLAGCSGFSASQSAPEGDARGQGDYASDTAEFGGVGSYYDESGDRIVVRTSEMTVRVEEFDVAFEDLRSIVDDHGGYFGDRSQRSEGEWDRAEITVRVPAQEFPAARDAIAELGRIEHETVDAKDFTSEYRQREDRITTLREEESQFEALLANASNASEATEIRSELRDIRDDLDRLTADQADLEQRETFSTITVTLVEPTDRKPAADYSTEWGFTDAFLAALSAGTLAIKVVIVLFGVVIPIGIAGILFGVVGVLLWRLWKVVYAGLKRLLGSTAESQTEPDSAERRDSPSNAPDSER